MNLDDTIAAIATPIGEAGIGIVRLSGNDALAIADEIFVAKDGRRPSEYETYTTHYGHIVANVQGSGVRGQGSEKLYPVPCTLYPETIDEVLLTVMRAPKSYTREDIVEINCHGGIAALKKTLELVLMRGARLAEPGEFTKKAFLNGRIDLAQAEAVLDIIRAKTNKGLEAALLQLKGGVSDSVRQLRQELVDIKAHIEASVDFPEEELDADSLKTIGDRLSSVRRAMEDFLDSFKKGRIVREGINCVICGKANVGKSSLMNELLKEERMIVTPIPGTTRDAVSEYINIDGIPINLVDTAGISESEHPLDKEGVRRSRLWLEKADLVLFVLDASDGLMEQDRQIVEFIKGKEVICVVNKIDLTRRMPVNRAELKRLFGRDTMCVEISALKKINLKALPEAILNKVYRGEVLANDYNMLTNARHRDAVFKASASVEEAAASIEARQPEEIISITLSEAINALGEITGESISEETLDRIFSQFCIGK
jgi:tRNA modification GTPase